MEPESRAPINFSAAVGKEIRKLLIDLDMTSADLAARMGENEMWVSRRLRGAVPIDLNDLYRITQALNVEVVDVVSVGAATRALVEQVGAATRAFESIVPAGEAFESVGAASRVIAGRGRKPNVRKASPADRPISPRPAGHAPHAVPAHGTRRPARVAGALAHV